ncbi:hypothetical protein JOB18_001170 [Solea senegalensis]|uniref:Uncharacterized protein n=1 Tax=Solea senegalensis TaxID=28829 RepID=A0AAV6R5E2_SOLSE|nr:hypothetical protein JOB18_001170 [Solea senegalensis]
MQVVRGNQPEILQWLNQLWLNQTTPSVDDCIQNRFSFLDDTEPKAEEQHHLNVTMTEKQVAR